MGKIFAIYKKDLASLFASPLAYVVIAIFTCINSYLTASSLSSSDIGAAFSAMVFLFIISSPFLTMRVFTEEYRGGTDELLLTSPVSLTQIVLGKFLASLTLAIIMIASSLQFVAVFIKYGATPDFGVTASAYLGVTLLAGAFISLGVFASSLTQNQIIAAFITLGGILLLCIIEGIVGVLGPGAKIFSDTIGVLAHYYDFEKGVIDTTNVLYYLSFIFVFLFLTVRRLDAKRL